jgi:hypothetical protein
VSEQVIAYRPEFARLPDADGKPLGTDAALLLSQAVWLAANRADAQGWAEWTLAQCEDQTGLTRRQQQRILPMLEAAGILKTDRRGEKGVRHIRLCGQFARKVQTEKHETCKQESENEMSLHETCKQENPDSTKGANRKARNVQTEPLPVSTKDIKTLKESPPYISPQKGEPRQARNVFVPPSLEEVSAYLAEIGVPHLAEQWLAYYQANGWKIGRNPMKDWRASCRTWKANERANVRGSPARAAPVQSNRTMADLAAEEGEALRRIFEKRGVQNGR